MIASAAVIVPILLGLPPAAVAQTGPSVEVRIDTQSKPLRIGDRFFVRLYVRNLPAGSGLQIDTPMSPSYDIGHVETTEPIADGRGAFVQSFRVPIQVFGVGEIEISPFVFTDRMGRRLAAIEPTAVRIEAEPLVTADSATASLSKVVGYGPAGLPVSLDYLLSLFLLIVCLRLFQLAFSRSSPNELAVLRWALYRLTRTRRTEPFQPDAGASQTPESVALARLDELVEKAELGLGVREVADSAVQVFVDYVRSKYGYETESLTSSELEELLERHGSLAMDEPLRRTLDTCDLLRYGSESESRTSVKQTIAGFRAFYRLRVGRRV